MNGDASPPVYDEQTQQSEYSQQPEHEPEQEREQEQEPQKKPKKEPLRASLPPRQGEPVPADKAIEPNKFAHVPGEKDDVDLGASLEDIVKKMFFVADDIGEPEIIRERNIVSLSYPDDSMVKISFEHRAGRHGGIGTLPLDDKDAENKNNQFKDNQQYEKDALEEVNKRKEVSIKGVKAKEEKEQAGDA